MFKVLFIEDEVESVETALSVLENSGHECKVVGFEDAEILLSEFCPHVVILDLVENGASGDSRLAGVERFMHIWEERFCPIVIYSANLSLLDDDLPRHPFVECVLKGRDSTEKISSTLEKFTPHIEALKAAEGRLHRDLTHAVRDVAPEVFAIEQDEERRKDAVIRMAERRVAAMMDDSSRHGSTLLNWQQYLSPAFGTDLLLGDVVQDIQAQNDPSSFYVVLTPSCDLACSSGRQPKVEEVLTAKCCSVADAICLLGHEKTGQTKVQKALRAIVSRGGFEASILFLPGLSGKIPPMAANFRSLKLISLKDVYSDSPKYRRVASIDSPFREAVSWAFLQTACRPGLPDRDYDAWTSEIVESRAPLVNQDGSN